jgi:hypothetical protein
MIGPGPGQMVSATLAVDKLFDPPVYGGHEQICDDRILFIVLETDALIIMKKKIRMYHFDTEAGAILRIEKIWWTNKMV